MTDPVHVKCVERPTCLLKQQVRLNVLDQQSPIGMAYRKLANFVIPTSVASRIHRVMFMIGDRQILLPLPMLLLHSSEEL